MSITPGWQIQHVNQLYTSGFKNRQAKSMRLSNSIVPIAANHWRTQCSMLWRNRLTVSSFRFLVNNGGWWYSRWNFEKVPPPPASLPTQRRAVNWPNVSNRQCQIRTSASVSSREVVTIISKMLNDLEVATEQLSTSEQPHWSFQILPDSPR